MHAKNATYKVMAVLVLLSMLLAACAPAANPTTAPEVPAAGQTHRLALIQFLKGHPVHRVMQLGFQEGCEARGYECDMLLTDSTSPVDMIPLAEQALAKGYEGVVLYAVDDSF